MKTRYVEDVVLMRIAKDMEDALFVGRKELLFTLLCLMTGYVRRFLAFHVKRLLNAGKKVEAKGTSGLRAKRLQNRTISLCGLVDCTSIMIENKCIFDPY